MERLRADVCVVGAGPAGLVVAHRLLQAHVPCVVVERLAAEALCARAKAGMLEHRTVLALSRHGLAAPILEHGTTNGVTEIRVGGAGRVFDYAALTGGSGHHVFPQHLLVRAWADQLVAAGGRLLWSTEATAVQVPEVDVPGTLEATADGRRLVVECRAVVLAAGAGCNLVPSGIDSHEHTHPFRWLTVMVDMPPLVERTVYAAHARGFAAHLRRSPQSTRYYLQIPATEGLGDWSDERVRAELELRLGVRQGTIAAAIVERDVLDLRVRVREPLQAGGVYLAGDAAHLITPAGGKGMNLAIQDGLELADGLIERSSQGDGARLARYSETRLPQIWRTQEFSNWMLTMFCGGALSFQRALPDPDAGFAQRLHRAQVDRLFAEPAFGRWFAHRYAGVDEV